jgi:hypothetical protein
MKQKSAHEPKAKVMDAAEVWEDAQQLAHVLRQNILQARTDRRVTDTTFSLSVGAR